MTVVVTGAAGFLGRHLVPSLLAAGRDVIACTRDASKLEARPRLRIVATDYEQLDIPNGSTVIHLAAMRNAPGPRTQELARVNVELAQRVARAAIDGRAHRFLYLSTALILGSSNIPRGAADIVDSHDPYIASRVAALRALEAMHGLPWITLLPSIVYGPDHPHARNRITSHMRRLLRRPLRFAVGGASEPRNLVFVDDVIRAIHAAEHDAIGTRRVIAGENVTQHQFEEIVFAAAGRKPTPRIVLPRAFVDLSARTTDAMLRREQGWTRRVQTLFAPWCFTPSPSHTLLRDGVRSTLETL